MAAKASRIGGYLLLAGLPMLVYLNSLGNPFQYDDFHSIVENPHLRDLGNIPAFFVDPTLFSAEPQNAMYRPLLLVTFALNHALSGYRVWSYHLAGMLLHAGSALLVWGIGRRLLKEELAAGLGALLFGLHPVHAEAVNYLSSRSELLGGFFLFLGLWAFLRWRQGEGRRWPIAAAFAAGLASKSIVMMLPVLLLVYDLTFGQERLSQNRGLYGIVSHGLFFLRAAARRLRRDWRLYGILGGIAVAYLGMVGRFLEKATIGAPVRSYSEQWWTQVKAVVFYLKLLLWPSGLSVDHQFLISDSPFDPFAGSAFLFLLSLVWLAFYHRRRHPLPLFLGLCFFISLAPASLIPLNVLVNEHRLYVPGGFFALAVAYFWGMLARRGAGWRKAGVLAGLVVLAGLGTATWQRNQVWRSVYTLWEDAAARAPLMARPQIFLGNAYAEDGRRAEAIQAFEKVVRRDPGFIEAYARLGELYRQQGGYEQAEEILREGLKRNPEEAGLWDLLGEVYRDQGRWEACAGAYERAVALEPEADGLRNNLGNAYQMLGRPAEALQQHRQALQIDATRAETWLNLGNAQLMLGEEQQALQGYQKAVELDPGFGGAWVSLGNLYERRGQKRAALEAYEKGAGLDPAYAGFAAERRRILEGEGRP